MRNKKGQGLSLNVIIVAALALIVLVVLVAIFTGRLGIFQSGIGGEAKSELRAMEAFYGDCHPNAAAETAFLTEYSTAAGLDDAGESEQGKAEAKAKLDDEINRCRAYSDKDTCDGDQFCAWS